jgi:endonuclease/exonuclease/phosphatase family metal-dependent hydrolase
VPLLLLLGACQAAALPETVAPGSAPAAEPAPASAPGEELQPPSPATVRLRVASWNIKRLGHGTKDLRVVADVLDDFDLVAVQEVMTREVVQELSAELPEHEALLTDVPTPVDGKYREYFAFFYRPDRLEPALNTYVPDPQEYFARDPYLACFDVADVGRRVCLMTVHITYGDRVAARKAEILALDDALRWAQDGDATSDWIVLGDCNRPLDDGDADEDPEEEWAELLDRRQLRVPVTPAGDEVPTTLGESDYVNSYDHIFVSAEIASGIVEAGRLDLAAIACAGSFTRCRDTVSDHAPIYVDVQLRAP